MVELKDIWFAQGILFGNYNKCETRIGDARQRCELCTSRIQARHIMVTPVRSIPQSVFEPGTTVAHLKIPDRAFVFCLQTAPHVARSIKQKRRDLRSIVWFVRIPPSILRHTRSSFVSSIRQNGGQWAIPSSQKDLTTTTFSVAI